MPDGTQANGECTVGGINLLLVTFEMDPASPVLAWQLRVARELALSCAHVLVLTHTAAQFDKPRNMTVHEFPKVLLRAPLRWIGSKWWLNAWIWELCRRHRIDACFIHMNIRWAYLLAPALWLRRIPTVMWYAHGAVSNRLRLAHRCVARVVTSTPDGFRLPSSKIVVIGQGIDTALFTPQPIAEPALEIITVGRISRRKRVHMMIDVMEALWALEPDRPFTLKIVGTPLTMADRGYLSEIADRIRQTRFPERIRLRGHIALEEIPKEYASTFLHLNLSETGSMDKSVMEALASGCPVLTSNIAFRDVLMDEPSMLLAQETAADIAERVRDVYRNRWALDPSRIRRLVVGHHDLQSYASRVLAQIDDLLESRTHQASSGHPNVWRRRSRRVNARFE